MSAQKYGQPRTLEVGRRNELRWSLWERSTPLELGGSDVVKCRIWDGTDGDAAYVTITSSGSTTAGSTITVDDVGDDSSTDDPAIITITVEPDDATLVPVDDGTTTTYLEITVARAASLTKSAVAHRCVLKVQGSPV